MSSLTKLSVDTVGMSLPAQLGKFVEHELACAHGFMFQMSALKDRQRLNKLFGLRICVFKPNSPSETPSLIGPESF